MNAIMQRNETEESDAAADEEEIIDVDTISEQKFRSNGQHMFQ